MRRSLCLIVCLVLLGVSLSGCYTIRHTVGDGGEGTPIAEQRQWYILWGLVPLNEVDGGGMARGESDYTIQSQMGPLDVLMNFFTGWVTIYSRTVKVEK